MPWPTTNCAVTIGIQTLTLFVCKPFAAPHSFFQSSYGSKTTVGWVRRDWYDFVSITEPWSKALARPCLRRDTHIKKAWRIFEILILWGSRNKYYKHACVSISVNAIRSSIWADTCSDASFPECLLNNIFRRFTNVFCCFHDTESCICETTVFMSVHFVCSVECSKWRFNVRTFGVR